MVNDQLVAEDMMHEAFIDAFQKLDQFKFEASFGSWIKRIVINKCLNHLRREEMIKEKEEEIEREVEVQSEEGDDWSSDFKVEDILQAAKQLAKKHHTIFQLYMIEGYDHEEIGEIMGISSSTSRSQLSRAKQNLKKILIEKLEQPYVRS